MEFVINALIHPLWPLLCHHPPQFIPWHKSCPPFSPHWIGKKMNGLTSRIFRNVEHTFSWKSSLQELYWVLDKDPDGSKVLKIYILYVEGINSEIKAEKNRKWTTPSANIDIFFCFTSRLQTAWFHCGVGWGPAYQTNLLCRCWSLQLTEYQTNCNAFDIFYLLFEVPKCVLNVCILCAF